MMTRVLDQDEAVRVLARGGIVALPTDTVYGVAASLRHPDAVATLFGLKHRPDSVPLPVLIDDFTQIERLSVTWPEAARRLSVVYWPGPLTIVVRVPDELAQLVGGVATTAGFRIPDDVPLREILARTGPLALSSANEHGDAPCHNVAEVLRAFIGRDELEGVVDGGERSGRVSTVVDLSETPWRLVREGAISSSDLHHMLD
jgi:L-threonylcarbamoyladenylate synthase